jgi:hypothetical protein
VGSATAGSLAVNLAGSVRGEQRVQPAEEDIAVENRNETEARIRAALEPLILGQVLPRWSCCCGAVGNGEARAVALKCRWPDCPGKAYAWTVEMQETANPAKGYCADPGEFVSREKLAAIFADA